MDVSKQIETYWLEHWKTRGLPPRARLTLDQARQQIITIDGWLIPAINQALPVLHQPKNYPNLISKINQIDITGIPTTPNYKHILLSALIQTKRKN